jgi:two-component system, chemotaxis family, chemotaxis protein CheY
MATILLIEDNPQVRPILRMMLQMLGHQVAEAEDGNQGIAVFQQNPAAVVFCDLFMPEKEGLETIRELRTLAPTVKIVAMSGGPMLGGPDFLRMARSLGADATLSKPFDVQSLRETLERLA